MDSLGLQVNRDGDVPVGTQLAWQIQSLITGGRLQPAEQLPSVRRLAEAVGVHVNTVRSVYERLEGEGFVHTHHGRGTFVAENVPQIDPARMRPPVRAEPAPASRTDLKEQITMLEAQLATHAAGPTAPGSGVGSRLLTTDELAAIRDELVSRLEQIDAVRDDLVGLLAALRTAIGDGPAAGAQVEKPRLSRHARAVTRPA